MALVGADAEFSNNVLIGARENAKKFGLQIVYDKTYPPATVDFTPIVRAIQATNPDRRPARLLSAGLGRHGAGRDRDRTQDRSCSAAPWSGCNTPR